MLKTVRVRLFCHLVLSQVVIPQLAGVANKSVIDCHRQTMVQQQIFLLSSQREKPAGAGFLFARVPVGWDMGQPQPGTL